jgi:uncharacterized NAD(P)/FAD-binding protein YdhS
MAEQQVGHQVGHPAERQGERADVLVIGGGASGTLLCAQLLRQARGPLRVVWVDRAGAFSRGLAYGAAEPWHLLNVPAANMSALPDVPGHLLSWCQAAGVAAGPTTFVPRLEYGRYLGALLEEAEAQGRAAGALLVRRRAEVASLTVEGDGTVRAELAGGEGPARLQATVAVLAPGNARPDDPRVADPDGVLASPAYVRSPWQPEALDRLPREAPVLLLGTGLTMADVVLSLRARGHRGPLLALSRRGLLPRVHAPPAPPRPPALPEGGSLRQLLRAFRQEVRQEVARAGEGAWRPVLDGLRPRTAALWQGLSPADKRRFLRHVRAYWEVHRHRLPPPVHEALEGMRQAGQLQVRAGRLTRLARLAPAPGGAGGAGGAGGGVALTFRTKGGRGAEETLEGAALVNCTGPTTDVRRLDTPLLAWLMDAGLARADRLGLGLDTQAGALVGRDGAPSQSLFALGPLRRAELWETTAIPEIRVQAQALAAALLGHLGVEPPRG